MKWTVYKQVSKNKICLWKKYFSDLAKNLSLLPFYSVFICLHFLARLSKSASHWTEVSKPQCTTSRRVQEIFFWKFCEIETSIMPRRKKAESQELSNPFPRPFKGPKMFWDDPDFLCQTKNGFTYCAGPKLFVPYQKIIFIY